MKRTLIITAARLLLSALSLSAQTKQKLTINEATVFLNGAELVSSATFPLAKGENEILFTNVAGNVNSQSLNISTTNDVVVQSTIFKNNYLNEEVSTPRIREIKDSIQYLVDSREEINIRIAVIDESIEVLQANHEVGGTASGLSVAELTKMLDLINARMEGLLTQKHKEETLIQKTDDRIARLNRQLNEEQQRGVQPGGQLLVKFYSKEATTTAVAISYVVSNAGWKPAYDVFADGASGPIRLYYKANIFQNTGVKWTNIKLTLSTGDPNESAEAPAIYPWYLAFYRPPERELRGITVMAYKAPLVDMDKPASHLLTREEVNLMPSSVVNDMPGAGASVYQRSRGGGLSLGGARGDGTQYIIDGVQVRGNSMNDHVAVDNTGVATTFDIDLPYTIPSDGQEHLVAIKDFKLPASYRYYAVPKADKDVFLQAQVTRWEDLNLLPGVTHLFFDGTYIGQGMLDVRNVKDTLNISLGRDKKIVIKREQDTKMHTRRVIGSHEHEAFGYNITVRNARKEPIHLILLDQLPVSTDKDIAVENKETGDADVEEKTNIMTWDMQLTGGEMKKVSFSYGVKYPRGSNVTGLR